MTGSEPQGSRLLPGWFVKGFRLLFLGLLAQAICLALLFAHHKLGLWPRFSDDQFNIGLAIIVFMSIIGWTFVLFLKVAEWMGVSLFGRSKR